ncbi:dephospho-CoA kinase [Halospina denitrificans]|uniref:Dephospho-CoA kinase n=1 Tax=Halospina denitrificans TaxID=332522 RepID=A0A4R7K043_9GAMM|nr:dephospho-CoA kinase [Halospina denitrificans]TDT43213.1 dephospho-CoA kinase [Halospina denitrificans]
MFVIGLTGGIGSGKSTVADLFRELGVFAIDADDVAREVVMPGEPALESIAEHFGKAILNEDGTLDRAALRKRVFEDDTERQWLEALLHPSINERLKHYLEEADSPYQLLVSPLLLETEQYRLCQHVLVVDVHQDTQIDRTMARDDNDREQIERIIASQMPRDKRLAAAGDVIDNDQPVARVRQQVDELHRHYLEMAAEFSGDAAP